MRTSQSHISAALSRELDALGAERDKKAACIVLIGSDEMEMIWPPTMDMAAIRVVERAVLEALQEQVADEA